MRVSLGDHELQRRPPSTYLQVREGDNASDDITKEELQIRQDGGGNALLLGSNLEGGAEKEGGKEVDVDGGTTRYRGERGEVEDELEDALGSDLVERSLGQSNVEQSLPTGSHKVRTWML